MTSNGVDTVDTESLPVDDLHVVEPRAAGRFSAISLDPVQQRGRSDSVRTPQCVRQPAVAEAEEEKVPGPLWPEKSSGGSPPLPSGVSASRQ